MVERSNAKGLRPIACWEYGVRIPPEARKFVSCDCYVLSGRALCYGPIPRPEKSQRLWCVRLNVIRKTSTSGGLGPRGLLRFLQ